MPELPEIMNIASQMRECLVGKTIADITILQPKCLNTAVENYGKTHNRRIMDVEARGKWIVISLEEDLLLLVSLGMGADTVSYPPGSPPNTGKYQVRVQCGDGSGFTLRFWWFGHFHMVQKADLKDHLVGQLGPSPLADSFTPELLASILRTSRRKVKELITDQRRIAGIGNAYVHDILFLAGLNPLAQGSRLDGGATARLHSAMRELLQRVLSKRGLAYERDFFGNPGEYGREDFLVGYREGEPCPRCSTAIEKIRFGGQSSFLCPSCQPPVK
ncbi:MAG: hypothetical protein LLG06_19205 [Desulfobacteraceae bacterium]|nr:hypothetical protein [Desulfobacteraceae bacterium]